MIATAPMLSAILGSIFLKEPPDRKTWVSIIITFAAIIYIFFDSLKLGNIYGDILGFKQSGLKKFKLADPILHKDLFILAEKEVKKIELKDKQIGEYYKLLKLYDRASILNDII